MSTPSYSPPANILDNRGGLQRHPLSSLLVIAYKVFNCRKRHRIGARLIDRVVKVEGGQFYSATARELIEGYHGVKVGAYSYGPCLTPGGFPAGVTVGRYVSIASNVRVSLLNKPMDRLAMHPAFYDPDLNGGIDTEVEYLVPLVIEHDAWIGDSALILPGCRRIGLGAVVGGGAVVTKDVPDFAIVAGNPARILRYRFSADVQERIRASRWWELAPEEFRPFMAEMAESLTECGADHAAFVEIEKARRSHFPLDPISIRNDGLMEAASGGSPSGQT